MGSENGWRKLFNAAHKSLKMNTRTGGNNALGGKRTAEQLIKDYWQLKIEAVKVKP